MMMRDHHLFFVNNTRTITLPLSACPYLAGLFHNIRWPVVAYWSIPPEHGSQLFGPVFAPHPSCQNANTSAVTPGSDVLLSVPRSPSQALRFHPVGDVDMTQMLCLLQ